MAAIPVRSKHAELSIGAMDQSEKELRGRPEELHTDQGTEYRGKMAKALQDRGVAHKESLRYSPWENGYAESRIGVVKQGTRAAMEDSNAPPDLWPGAVKWAADTETLMNRAHDALHGTTSGNAARKNAGPFACVVFMVREIPEEVEGDTFAPKSVKGFTVGTERTARCAWDW